MKYVISDIHGEYEQFITLLKRINFSDKDTLYVLGDVVDRGPEPIKVLQYMMTKPNIVPIIGNHEVMAYEGLKLLLNEITDDFVKKLNKGDFEMLSNWTLTGATPTIREFLSLSTEKRAEIWEYIGEFVPYKEVSVGGNEYLLVHAGIERFDPEKPMEEYAIDDLVWGRIDYEIPYYDDVYTVSGHTPTQSIPGNTRPGYIYQANHHIAIDCGSYRNNGRLAAICLDTGEEFYSR